MMLNEKRLAWSNGELSDAEWLSALLEAQAEVLAFMLKSEGDAGEVIMNSLLKD